MCVFPWASGHNAERIVETCMHTHLCMSRYQDTPGAGASQGPLLRPCPLPLLLAWTATNSDSSAPCLGHPLEYPTHHPYPTLTAFSLVSLPPNTSSGDSDIHPGHRGCVCTGIAVSIAASQVQGPGASCPITPTEPNLICLQPGRLGVLP